MKTKEKTRNTQTTNNKAAENAGIPKFTLFLGLNDKDTLKQEIPTAEARAIVINMIAERFDGGTLTESLGVYRHGGGAVTLETSLIIELLFTEAGKVLQFVTDLKKVFNQETIAVQSERIFSELL